jgi:hypothetical protein
MVVLEEDSLLLEADTCGSAGSEIKEIIKMLRIQEIDLCEVIFVRNLVLPINTIQ